MKLLDYPHLNVICRCRHYSMNLHMSNIVRMQMDMDKLNVKS